MMYGESVFQKKWVFCPIARAALELGLNRRALIKTIKNSYSLTEDLVLNYMKSKGYSKEKCETFTVVWDLINAEENIEALADDELLEFTALMADKYSVKEIEYEDVLIDLANEELENFKGEQNA